MKITSSIFGTGNYEHGTWWLRFGRVVFLLKASWNEPLFSERYGYYKARVPIGFGWRLVVKRDKAQA